MTRYVCVYLWYDTIYAVVRVVAEMLYVYNVCSEAMVGDECEVS